jgi:hypothetical protein
MLDTTRVTRFLYLATCVTRLRVYNNPHKWVKWTCLERLLLLVEEADDGRFALLPWVTHCTFQVGPHTRQLTLAPIVKLVANPTLQYLWVEPLSPNQHPFCSIEDASQVFETLSTTRLPTSCLEWLSIFPEATRFAPTLRPGLVSLFVPLATHLRYCTISAWMLSQATLLALAQAPLRRLEVQGRFAVDAEDLSMMSVLEMPEGSFAELATLIISNVPLQVAYQLLSTHIILDNVQSLRVEIAVLNDLDNDEDTLYTQLFQRLTAAPALRNLCLIASREESDHPLSIAPNLLLPLINKNLDVLRLYRFSIADTSGFSILHAGKRLEWANLTQLAVMHQDLTPEDLVELSHFPCLKELSGNVSIALGTRRRNALGDGFACHLKLSSQFRFPSVYLETTQNVQLVGRIAW